MDTGLHWRFSPVTDKDNYSNSLEVSLNFLNLFVAVAGVAAGFGNIATKPPRDKCELLFDSYIFFFPRKHLITSS